MSKRSWMIAVVVFFVASAAYVFPRTVLAQPLKIQLKCVEDLCLIDLPSLKTIAESAKEEIVKTCNLTVCLIEREKLIAWLDKWPVSNDKERKDKPFSSS